MAADGREVMMSATTERVESFVAPVASDLGLTVYDVELAGGILRVLLDADGGVDVDRLTEASRRISRWLDESESSGEPVVSGHYSLEVSSPGLERTLRTASHFSAAVGESVRIKLKPGVAGDRRIDGTLVAVGGPTVTVRLGDGTTRDLARSDIERARTNFEWGPAPKPGSGAKRGKRSTERSTTDARDHATNSEAQR
jgi:ribosome maturation factor RimP